MIYSELNKSCLMSRYLISSYLSSGGEDAAGETVQKGTEEERTGRANCYI